MWFFPFRGYFMYKWGWAIYNILHTLEKFWVNFLISLFLENSKNVVLNIFCWFQTFSSIINVVCLTLGNSIFILFTNHQKLSHIFHVNIHNFFLEFEGSSLSFVFFPLDIRFDLVLFQWKARIFSVSFVVHIWYIIKNLKLRNL